MLSPLPCCSEPKVLQAIGPKSRTRDREQGAIQPCSVSAQQRLAIDLACNDALDYHEFFAEYRPRLNLDGGSMIFHDTVNGCPSAACG